ncbi:hypothetical protein YTPLAS18_00730 [Nitrospira sp.]|nr:hypothetical protein YTPLAS18_00730 [Nitrospira sp.]
MKKDRKKVLAGRARVKALSPEERQQLARKAGMARWHRHIPVGIWQGDLRAGGAVFRCHVLSTSKRIIEQESLLTPFGLFDLLDFSLANRSTRKEMVNVVQLLARDDSAEQGLLAAMTPILFQTKDGAHQVGYEVELLLFVCQGILEWHDKLRVRISDDAALGRAWGLAERILKDLKTVSLDQAVDQATGYQAAKDFKTLTGYLRRDLRPNLAAWALALPQDFYWGLFRIRGWSREKMHLAAPPELAATTTDLVFERMPGGCLRELLRARPHGKWDRRLKETIRLFEITDGPMFLTQHVHALCILMLASDSWEEFKRLLDRALPRTSESLGILHEFDSKKPDDTTSK